MRSKSSIFLFIPLILLVSISCTCGTPKLTDFMSKNDPNNIVGQAESEIQASESIQESVETPESEITVPEVGTGITGGDIDVFNVNHFLDDDYVSVIGLMRNNTNSMIGGVDLSIIFYDANGEIIATESVYPSFSLLPPGETVPFYISSSDWQDFSSYEFIIDEYYESDQEIVDGVVVTNERLDLGGYTPVLIGELENTSTVTVGWVNVAIMVYDSNGILIDAVNSYSMLDEIQPGGKSPFKMYMTYNWDDYEHYDLIVQASEAYEEPADLSVTDYEVTVDDYGTTFTGNIKNNSAGSVTYATIVATLYDENGKIVAAEWTFAEEDEIPANGTGTFELTFWEDVEYSEVVFQVQ